MSEASAPSSTPPVLPRLPEQHRVGKENGFIDSVRVKMTSPDRPRPNFNALAANSEKATNIELRELRDAVQRRQMVENLMELGGMYFPG